MQVQEIIEQLRLSGDRSAEDNSPHFIQLRQDFRQVLEVFIASNHSPDLDGDTLMCSIHNAFPSHHSCVACNLNENERVLERFLLYAESLPDVHYSFTTLLILLYLIVERIHVYFEFIKIPTAYRSKHFQVFQEVKCWANFLKHPKSFMLVTHPGWEYEGMVRKWAGSETAKRIIINSAFTKLYYTGDDNNAKLYKLLARKDNVVVLFPNPVDLMKRFVKAQQKFVSVINENEMVREMLESETMEKQHFLAESEFITQTN